MSFFNLIFQGGKEYSAYTEIPKGDPENPSYHEAPSLFNKEIEDKFKKLLSTHPDFKDWSDTISKIMNDHENLKDVNELAQHLIK